MSLADELSCSQKYSGILKNVDSIKIEAQNILRKQYFLPLLLKEVKNHAVLGYNNSSYISGYSIELLKCSITCDAQTQCRNAFFEIFFFHLAAFSLFPTIFLK